MNATTQIEEIKPPATDVGILGWLKRHLFNSVFNSVATILIVGILIRVIPDFIQWAFIDSVWFTSGQECKDIDGACWSVVTQNIRFNIFGYYPYEHQWRPLAAMIILVGMLIYSRDWNKWNKTLGYTWLIALFTMGILMKGGLFGLVSVESTKWSGLPLTLLLSFFGILASYPLGVVLALGRQSNMPIIKSLCIVYIEMIRSSADHDVIHVICHVPAVLAGRHNDRQSAPGSGRDYSVYRCVYSRGCERRPPGNG